MKEEKSLMDMTNEERKEYYKHLAEYMNNMSDEELTESIKKVCNVLVGDNKEDTLVHPSSFDKSNDKERTNKLEGSK